MTGRRPYRPRKIVDYSKFASEDSDDDDFSDAGPCKKSKSSSSDSGGIGNSKSHSSTKPRSNVHKEERKNENKEVDVSNEPILSRKSNDKENRVGETQRKETNINKKGCLGTLNTDDVNVDSCKTMQYDEDANENELEKRGYVDESSECVSDDDGSEGDINGSNEDNKLSATNAANCRDTSTKTEEKEACSEKSFSSPATVKLQLASKWKAPGPASASTLKRTSDVIYDSASKSNTYLRIGLSRKIKVKSLHANVKIRP